MMAVSTPYVTTGRTDQKRRTRDALVAAARELVASGVSPTVEEVAQRAAISRTTAYRYFPNQRSLLVAAHPEVGASSLLPPEPPDEPAERLDAVIATFTRLILDTEPQQRTMLRLSLDPDPAERGSLPLRQGRGVAWIAEALEPLSGDLTSDELRTLALAIRSATGIEALVWLTDVGGLTRDAAVELMRWSAQSLLHAALTSSSPPLDGPGG